MTAIQDFYLDLTIPIPTHRPLVISIQAHLFSSKITRLSLPPTCYSFPKPTGHFLNVFTSLFQWDVHVFNGDVEKAYACWNMWAQQYLTLLSNTDFHSRGNDPCIKTGLLALPSIRELPTTHRPYMVLLYPSTVPL